MCRVEEFVKKNPHASPRNLPDPAMHLEDCQLCPHRCGVQRAQARGLCRVGREAYVASEMLHMGEEQVLRPTHAIFFSGCTATCSFCTAARIAFRPTYGVVVTPQALAERILQRQAEGARSVACIGGDPIPHLPFVAAVRATLGERLAIPLVFNSNYYLTPEALEIVDAVADIHLPDLKFGPPAQGCDCGVTLGGMPGYWEVVTSAIAALHDRGRRVIVRHLLMPGHFACCTRPVLTWLAQYPRVEVSLLTQYLAPAHMRGELAQALSHDEIAKAQTLARALRLHLIE